MRPGIVTALTVVGGLGVAVTLVLLATSSQPGYVTAAVVLAVLGAFTAGIRVGAQSREQSPARRR